MMQSFVLPMFLPFSMCTGVYGGLKLYIFLIQKNLCEWNLELNCFCNIFFFFHSLLTLPLSISPSSLFLDFLFRVFLCFVFFSFCFLLPSFSLFPSLQLCNSPVLFFLSVPVFLPPPPPLLSAHNVFLTPCSIFDIVWAFLIFLRYFLTFKHTLFYTGPVH